MHKISNLIQSFRE